MKKFALISQALLALALTPSISANPGFPTEYEGVMLQGFYWDSYEDTKWTNMTSQVDELSKYFDLIWIPNSGSCGSGKQMGYMPQYWFTNHNSSFGTEEELLNMIRVFKEKGICFIADVVINHRNGVTNWTDFPTEEWNGTKWKIGPEGICRNDAQMRRDRPRRPAPTIPATISTERVTSTIRTPMFRTTVRIIRSV